LFGRRRRHCCLFPATTTSLNFFFFFFSEEKLKRTGHREDALIIYSSSLFLSVFPPFSTLSPSPSPVRSHINTQPDDSSFPQE
jgi:hypothetical protein